MLQCNDPLIQTKRFILSFSPSFQNIHCIKIRNFKFEYGNKWFLRIGKRIHSMLVPIIALPKVKETLFSPSKRVFFRRQKGDEPRFFWKFRRIIVPQKERD